MLLTPSRVHVASDVGDIQWLHHGVEMFQPDFTYFLYVPQQLRNSILTVEVA